MKKNAGFVASGLQETDPLIGLLKSKSIAEGENVAGNKRELLNLLLELVHDDKQVIDNSELQKAIELCDSLAKGKEYKAIIDNFVKQHSAYYHD